MAEVITKLVIDSQDYDRKIKNAAQGLQHYAEACKKAGGTLEYVDEEALAFARDLGQMSTVAGTARQRFREYTEAIAGAAATYRQMTDAEKNGDFGKALAGSIEQLKVKAAELQDVMRDTNREVQNLASDTAFTDGLNLMTRTLGASASAIVAWTGDSKQMEQVIKDLAKIGTTVAAVDQLTKAFQKQNLVLLKNPYVAAAAAVVALGVAISRLVQKSNELTEAQKALTEAQKAAASAIGNSVGAITGKFKALQTEWESLSTSAQKNQWIEDNKSAFNQLGLSINSVNDADNIFITNSEKVVAALQARAKATALQTLYEDKLKAAYTRAQEESASNWSVVSRSGDVVPYGMDTILGRGDYRTETRSDMDANQFSVSYLTDSGAAKVNEYRKRQAVKDAERLTQQYVKEVDDIYGQMYSSSLAEARSAEQNADGLVARLSGTNTSSASPAVTKDLTPLEEAQRKITDLTNEALTADDDRLEIIRGEIALLQEQVAEYKKIQDYVRGINQSEPEQAGISAPGKSQFEQLQQSIRIRLAEQNFEVDQNSLTGLMSVAIQHGIDSLNPEFERVQQLMAEGFNIPEETWERLQNLINEKLAELNIAPIELDVYTGNLKELNTDTGEAATKLKSAASAVAQLGGAMQQIEDPAVKVAGIIASAIANVALGVGQLLASPEATSEAWGWIALAATATATMISTISAIKSATAGSYAQGGIVPGTSFSGDRLTANVNSGELILNRAQQDAVAAQLESGNMLSDLRLTTKMSGTDLLIILDNANAANGGTRGYYSNTH